MSLTSLINDIDFNIKVTELRKEVWMYVKNRKKLIDTDYGKLQAALQTGRIDEEGISVVAMKLNNPGQSQVNKYYEDVVAEHFSFIDEFAKKHGESITVVVSLLIAFATTKNDISDVLTTTEAATEWGIDPSTIRHAIDNKRFDEDEYRKSGPRSWLILRSGMERVFGKPKKTPTN